MKDLAESPQPSRQNEMPSHVLTDRCVIQFGNRTLKGHTDASLWMKRRENHTSPPVQLLGDSLPQQIQLDAVKAVFFVKTFEGKSHDDLSFYDLLSPMDCLWIRVTFQDDEIIEGIIRNNADFAFQDGFFMAPIDPEGNNWLVYVYKTQLRDLRILGLRPASRNLPTPVAPA